MNYRTRVFLLLLALALLTNGCLLINYYYSSKKLLMAEIQSVAKSIVATGAISIPPTLVQAALAGDVKSGRLLTEKLNKLREINRRSDIYAKYLYIVAPYAGKIRYLADAEKAYSIKNKFGGSIQFLQPRKSYFQFDKLFVLPGLYEDQWGTWLTANAPIINSAGQAIAGLRVDIRANDIMHQMDLLLIAGLYGLLVSGVFAIFIASLLTHNLGKPLLRLRNAFREVAHGHLDATVLSEGHDEFAEMMTEFNHMLAGLQQREKLKISLTRYVSKHVAETLLITGNLPEIMGERRQVTALICDIRNFTSLAEKLNPEIVVKVLNMIFDRIVDSIFDNNGMLDKYLGDGFMALFGAPLEDEDQANHALDAALSMQKGLSALEAELKSKYGLVVRMGIGVNTGFAIVGNIGSSKRMEYTAIGDTINLASRLECATKEMDSNILISQSTYEMLKHSTDYKFKSYGAINVKGREQGVQVYGVEPSTKEA